MRTATFKTKENLAMENSFGIIYKDNDVEIEVSVHVNDSDQYGSFELYDIDTGGDRYYAEGGLWFEGTKLVDYDGVFSLTDSVVNQLKEWGYDTEICE